MRYYVTADVHGYFSELKSELAEKGFFEDKEPHKLIICGDIYDRGTEALELQNFILDLMSKNEVILIRGNHEDYCIRAWEDDQKRFLFRSPIEKDWRKKDKILKNFGYVSENN